jgi:twitching motility protein PilT
MAAIRFADAIETARRSKASDVHLESGLPPILRRDGELERLAGEILTAGDLDEVAAGLLSEGDRERLARDGDFTVSRDDCELGLLRIHCYRGTAGVTLAVRLLERKIPTLESLRLPEAMNAFPHHERGIVILAGPTGSGKSTTLAALISRINERYARRILTIEDPIEYRHESRRSIVTQREIGRDTPNLGAALRGALRADPDTIVVGEMRDAETMAGALAAAETGHLVLTTLHTGDAAQTVDRIVDSFSGGLQNQIRVQLAQVLVAVACQHLVRRACGTGRRAAVELLIGSDAVRNLIREAKSHQLRNVMATGKRLGMQTLEQHATELVRDREIDANEARRLGVPDAERTVT